MGVRSWRRLASHPRAPHRKQVLTFGLVVLPVALYLAVGSNWATGFLTVLVGVLLTTDYAAIDRYVSSRLYEWIQATDSLLDVVERNYLAKQYAESDYDEFDLTYWENGDFRATVEAERPIRPGMRFKIRCNVPSIDEEIAPPISFCTAQVDAVSAEDDGRVEVSLSAVRWFHESDGRDERDRAVYRWKIEQLRTDSDEVSPDAALDESDELDDLDLEEWRTLVDALEKTRIHERPR